MSKRCELQKEYYQQYGNYKGNGKHNDEYVSWLEEQILALRIHSVMQVPQFEELLQVRLDELPYTKHLDDGQYNDGQMAGFECGARWLYEKLSSGTTVASEGKGEDDMSGVELQPDEVCCCGISSPTYPGSNQCIDCNKNRL